MWRKYAQLIGVMISLSVAQTFLYSMYFYSSMIGSSNDLLTQLAPATATFMVMSRMAIMYLLHLTEWRAPACWAMMDGMQVTENLPRCPFTISSFHNFW